MEGITFSQNTGKEFYREGNLIYDYDLRIIFESEGLGETR